MAPAPLHGADGSPAPVPLAWVVMTTDLPGLGARARGAARVLAQASSAAKDAALHAAAEVLLQRSTELLDANRADVERAERDGSSVAVVDRLRLTPARVEGMASGLRKVADLPDPVGEVTAGWVRPNGLRIRQVRVPLGVVGIIYENRPNVTSDAAALCVKSGNAAFLRGSSGAISSNQVIASVLREGFAKAGLPEDSVVLVEDTSRESAVDLHAPPGLHRLPHPARRAVAHRVDPRARHRALRDRRRRELPRVRRRVGRSRHGRRHHRQRQDAAAERLQRRREPPRPLGRGAGVPAPGGRRARGRRAGGRRGEPGARAHGRGHRRRLRRRSSSR